MLYFQTKQLYITPLPQCRNKCISQISSEHWSQRLTGSKPMTTVNAPSYLGTHRGIWHPFQMNSRLKSPVVSYITFLKTESLLTSEVPSQKFLVTNAIKIQTFVKSKQGTSKHFLTKLLINCTLSLLVSKQMVWPGKQYNETWLSNLINCTICIQLWVVATVHSSFKKHIVVVDTFCLPAKTVIKLFGENLTQLICTILRASMYNGANLVWFSANWPRYRMWNMRSPPLTYSMTKKRCSDVWKQEWRLVRKGGLPCMASTLRSFIVHSTSSSCTIRSFFKLLMA